MYTHTYFMGFHPSSRLCACVRVCVCMYGSWVRTCVSCVSTNWICCLQFVFEDPVYTNYRHNWLLIKATMRSRYVYMCVGYSTLFNTYIATFNHCYYSNLLSQQHIALHPTLPLPHVDASLRPHQGPFGGFGMLCFLQETAWMNAHALEGMWNSWEEYIMSCGTLPVDCPLCSMWWQLARVSFERVGVACIVLKIRA